MPDVMYGYYCYRCGKPAVSFYNTSMTLASSVPSKMEPVCDEHNPFQIIIKGKPPVAATPTNSIA